MSYVVQVWEQPPGYAWPRTVDDAVAWVDFLQDLSPGQNPKFIEFARRVVERYPDLTSPEADRLPTAELAWSAGPIEGKTEELVYSIGIATSKKFTEVRPFVLATARALGLAVADNQAGEFHYPNGLILDVKDKVRSDRPEASIGRAADDLLPKEGVLDLVCLQLAARLRRHGFVLQPAPAPAPQDKYLARSLLAPIPTGWHELVVTAYDRRPGYMAFGVDVASCFRAVSALQRRIDAGLPPDAPLSTQAAAADPDSASSGDRATTFLRQNQWLVDERRLTGTESVLYILCSMADLSPAVDHLARQLESRLLPLLRCYASLRALDAACNSAFDAVSLRHSIFFSGYYRYSLHHLHIAYLAGNPRLPALCDKFESMLGREGRSAFSGEDDKVRNCIEYLRGHPRGPRR